MSGSRDSTATGDDWQDPAQYTAALASLVEMGLLRDEHATEYGDVDDEWPGLRRQRVPESHYGSMSHHNEHSLMCMEACNILTEDIAFGACRLGVMIDPIFDTAVDRHRILGERLSFDLMNTCFARAVTDAVFDWLNHVPQFERVHMAYAALLNSASQMREQIDNVAGALVDAHLETLALERPRALCVPQDPDFADFRIQAEADLTCRENLDRVYASTRHANWLTRMDEQYVRTREAVASQSFEDFVRDYRADYNLRVAQMTSQATTITFPATLSNCSTMIPNQTGSMTVAPMNWVSLANSIHATVTTFAQAATSYATTSTIATNMQNVPPNWHGEVLQCVPASGRIFAYHPPTKTATQRKLERQKVRRGRRALNKSIKLYRAFRGVAEIKAFAKGDTVTITGHLYNYEVVRRRQATLLEHTIRPPNGVIPYHLTMLAKDGTRLANGCVYFEDTPILDQILALALHVQDREEELALHKVTVWSSRTLAFEADPVLSQPRPATHTPPGTQAVAAEDTAAVAQLRAWTEHGSAWNSERQRLRQSALIAVRDDMRSRLAIPFAVVEFMENPSFRLHDVLIDTPDGDQMRAYSLSMDLLRIAMDIDTDAVSTLALVSALSGVAMEDLANPDHVIPGLTTLSGEPFAARPEMVTVA